MVLIEQVIVFAVFGMRIVIVICIHITNRVNDRKLLIQGGQITIVLRQWKSGSLKYQCRQIVCTDLIQCRFRNIIICPDHKWCGVTKLLLFRGQLIETGAEQFFIKSIFNGGQMIPEHTEDGRF